VYTSKFTNLFYGPWRLTPDEKPKTAMKLICQGPEERIVGLHVIGMGADEMLQVRRRHTSSYSFGAHAEAFLGTWGRALPLR
jgi:hypothetical protein